MTSVSKIIASGLPSPPIPSEGENWTVTCFSCGMPSSSVWAKQVRCHPKVSNNCEPYFPNLSELPCTNGASLKEDGTTHLCAFCFASLESQWNDYEKQTTSIHPRDRKYNLQKFICAVCGVQTYRKRVRALPYAEFPFLTNERQPGSLTLGQNPLAIVCLDCSETLWAQSAEYERWGLPIQKRHFNWLTRPAPPENSMEATVARLPSGELQLPRCPPTEPSISGGKLQPCSDYGSIAQSLQVETKCNKVEISRKTSKGGNNPMRKSSETSTTNSPNPETPPLQFPPVVTVAPMSSHKNSTSTRKNTTSISSNQQPSDFLKIHSNGPPNDLLLAQALNSPFIPRVGTPNMIDSPPYKGFHWSPREYNPYNLQAVGSSPGTNNPWPWIPASSSEFVNYQAYLSSLSSRNYNSPESYVPSHSLYSSPLSLSQTALGLSNPTYDPPFLSPLPTYSDSNLSSDLGLGQPSASCGLDFSKYLTSEKAQNLASVRHSEFNDAIKNGLDNSNSNRKVSDSENESISTFISNTKERSRRHNYHHAPAIKSSSLVSTDNRSSESKTETEHNLSINLGKVNTTKQEIGKIKYSSHSSPENNLRNQQRVNGSNTNFGGSELRKRSESEVSTQEKINTRPRSSSFSIAFLCNESIPDTPFKTQAQEITTRDSVIVSTISPMLSKTANTVHTKLNVLSQSTITSSSMNLSTNQSQSQCSCTSITSNIAKTDTYNSSNDIKQSSNATSDLGSNVVKPLPSESEKTEKLSEAEEKQFIEKSLQEYKDKERERLRKREERSKRKEQFLSTFNLVTPRQFTEIELKKATSRAEQRTLPPLKLRPESPQDDLEDEDFTLREARLVVAEENELDESVVNTDQHLFLEQLGLKVTTTEEKLKKKQQWCLTLTERLLRRNRNNNYKLPTRKRRFSSLYGSNGASDTIASLAKICRIDPIYGSEKIEPMRNLSVILASDIEDLSKPWVLTSSDLLSIVNCANASLEEFDGDSKLAIVQPVITYPKYIPSYASAEQENNLPLKTPEMAEPVVPSILNIPSIRVATSNTEFSTTLQEIDSSSNIPPICIPKVPVINLTARTKSASSHCENQNPETNTCTEDTVGNNSPKNLTIRSRKGLVDEEKVQVDVNVEPTYKNGVSKRFDGVDVMLQKYNVFWKGMQTEINSFISSVSLMKDDKMNGSFAIGEIRKMRKALRTYQAEMKVCEKKLRKGEEDALKLKSPQPRKLLQKEIRNVKSTTI